MASLGVLGNNYAEFPAGAAAEYLIGRACSRFETNPRRARHLEGVVQGQGFGRLCGASGGRRSAIEQAICMPCEHRRTP
jgi:hypothetical protein